MANSIGRIYSWTNESDRMKIPRLSCNIDQRFVEQIDSENYAYRLNGVEYCLDSTSLFIAQHCNGENTGRDVIEAIKIQFPDVDSTVIEQDIVEVLTRLIKLGLICEEVVEHSDWASPLLVTGSPRSGSSALTSALSTHKNFCITDELNLYGRTPTSRAVWIRMQMKHGRVPAKVCNSSSQFFKDFQWTFPLPSTDALIRHWIFNSVGNKDIIYGDKMPLIYNDAMEQLMSHVPKVKFLVTMRDGRAVIASQIRHYDYANNVGREMTHWMKNKVSDAENVWLDFVKKWSKNKTRLSPSYLEIKYEDAVADPYGILKRICHFVNIEYRAADFEAFFKQYKPVNVNRWRQEFPHMNDMLSDEFKDVLVHTGYEL